MRRGPLFVDPITGFFLFVPGRFCDVVSPSADRVVRVRSFSCGT